MPQTSCQRCPGRADVYLTTFTHRYYVCAICGWSWAVRRMDN